MATHYTTLLTVEDLKDRFDERTVRRLSNDANDPDTEVAANIEMAIDHAAAHIRSLIETDYYWPAVVADADTILVVKGWQALIAMCLMYKRRGTVPDDMVAQENELLKILKEGLFYLPVGKQSKAYPARQQKHPHFVFDDYWAPFPYDPNYRDNQGRIGE